MWTERLETLTDSYTCPEDLTGDCRLVGIQRIEDTELKPIEPELFGKFIVQLFLGDRCLRHAEATESACRHQMGMHSLRQRTIVRDEIGARCMHRHATGTVGPHEA